MTSDNELKMYGCSIADFRESMEDSCTFKLSGYAMVIASLMSEAQEEIAHGSTEYARQTLNRAKWVLFEYCMKERV